MRFADTRPPVAIGRKYLNKSAGQIMAEMFAGGGAVRLAGRQEHGASKDPDRSPMSLRWQAAWRSIQNEARLERFNARQAKREARAVAP